MYKDDKKIKVSKKVVVILIVLIILFFIGIKVFNNKSKYERLETSMLATAKSLVQNNFIEVKEQYYFTLSKMGVKETYDCNKDSGVNIVNNNGVFKYEAYLICDSYKSASMKKSNGKYIELAGANPLIIQNNTAFVDPGYESNYEVKRETNYKNYPGFYIMAYLVYDKGVLKETVNRYIIVGDIESSDAPTITLTGDENIIIKQGSSYVEPGYTATDKQDGNITNKVIKKSNVNSNVIGEYEIVYTVMNSKGLSTSKKRIVSVISKNANIIVSSSVSPEKETKDKVVITLKIKGSNYSHTVFPNGLISYDENPEYEVRENGTTTFKIYDKYGDYTEKKVVVKNIERTAPTGTCSATQQGGVVTYFVNAKDDTGIKGYSYYTSYGYTEIMSTNTFKYVMDLEGASVKIQDVAGNTTMISCEGKRISTITDISLPTSKEIQVGETYTIPVTITPSNANEKELYYELVSGDDIIALNDNVVVGKKIGTATIRVRVKDSTIDKTITINVREKPVVSSNWSPDPNDTSEIANWCGHNAAGFTAKLNGQTISPGQTITMKVGQTIRINLYLTKACGTIKQLTRTSASGQGKTTTGGGWCGSDDNTCWKNWFSASSSPSVNSANPSTFVATDHYDWIITANKKTNGSVALSQTATQSTSKFIEIKSMIKIYVIAN